MRVVICAALTQTLNLKYHFGGKEIIFILTEEYLQFATVLKFQQSVVLFIQRFSPFLCLFVGCNILPCLISSGKLALIEVDKKKPAPLFPENLWFPCKGKVKSLQGDIQNFPV